MKRFLVFVLSAAVIGISGTAWAGAVNHIGGFGTRGLGMAAGMAVANDAAAFYYNPALLLNAGNFTQAGMEYVQASFEYTAPNGIQFSSDKGKYFVPIVGINQRLNEKTAVGIGFITPNAFGADFKEKLNSFSKLSLTEIVPAASYKILDSWTVGAAVKIGNGQIELSKPTATGGRIDIKADGYGYSGQIGVLWQPAKWAKLGLSYQTKTKVYLNGTGTMSPSGAANSLDAEFYFPGYYGVGLGMEFGNLLIAADAIRFDYGSTDNVNIRYKNWGNSNLALDWKDNTYYGAGAEYKLDNWRLRTGLCYQAAVIPDNTVSPVTPDMNGPAVSVGLGYRGKKINADFAYQHSWGRERTVPLPNAGAGTYSSAIDTLSASASYFW